MNTKHGLNVVAAYNFAAMAYFFWLAFEAYTEANSGMYVMSGALGAIAMLVGAGLIIRWNPARYMMILFSGLATSRAAFALIGIVLASFGAVEIAGEFLFAASIELGVIALNLIIVIFLCGKNVQKEFET